MIYLAIYTNDLIKFNSLVKMDIRNFSAIYQITINEKCSTYQMVVPGKEYSFVFDNVITNEQTIAHKTDHQLSFDYSYHIVKISEERFAELVLMYA